MCGVPICCKLQFFLYSPGTEAEKDLWNMTATVNLAWHSPVKPTCHFPSQSKGQILTLTYIQPCFLKWGPRAFMYILKCGLPESDSSRYCLMQMQLCFEYCPLTPSVSGCLWPYFLVFCSTSSLATSHSGHPAVPGACQVILVSGLHYLFVLVCC